jgi:branched-chain amino acid transport system substrate-binding protein
MKVVKPDGLTWKEHPIFKAAQTAILIGDPTKAETIVQRVKVSQTPIPAPIDTPKSVEQTRKLIERDEVAFLFSPLGTPGIGATIKYVNAKKVPHLFVVSGVTKFSNFSEFPMTTTGLPSYNTEGRIYAKYITRTLSGAKIAILYQNDDLDRDFVSAFRDALKDEFDIGYEVTEPTIDSRVVSL